MTCFKGSHRFLSATVVMTALACIYVVYNDVTTPNNPLDANKPIDELSFDSSPKTPPLSSDLIIRVPCGNSTSNAVLPENHLDKDGRYPILDYLHLNQSDSDESRPGQMEEGERNKIWNILLEKLKKEKRIKKLPNIIGIGVQKCGTFALRRFLSFHPLIEVNPTEGNFFNRVPQSEKDRLNYINIMDRVPESAYAMEKTPAYFFDDETAQRIKRVAPEAKLLLILCDPTHRVASNFAHAMNSKLKKTFELRRKYDTVDQYVDDILPKLQQRMGSLDEKWNVTTVVEKRRQLSGLRCFGRSDLYCPLSIFEKGFYMLYLLPWLKYYNESNLLIVNGNEMLMDPGSVLERVQAFLRLPRLLLKSDFVKDPKTGFFCFKDWKSNGELRCMPDRKTRTRNKQLLSKENTKRLKKMYSSYNEALYTTLGANLGW